MPLSVTRRDIVFFILSAVLVSLFVYVAGGWGFPLDDSWIHQTYGRNLAQNGEWAFIPGQPSAASTSPLYTIVLAIGYFLRLPYQFYAHFIGTLALTITAILGANTAKIILPDSKTAGWWVGFGIIFTWHMVWAAASGMETMIFGMMTILLIFLAFRETEENRSHDPQSLLIRGAIFGVATAITALARPEGILLGGIAALLMLITRPQGSIKNVIIYGVGAAIGFFVILSPYLWLNYQLTGGVLPNTASAKFEQHAYVFESYNYIERFTNLALAIMAGGQFMLIPGIIAYVWMKLRGDNILRGIYFLLPVLWGLAHIALYAARLPAWYQHGRYVMPTLPAFVMTGVIGTIWLIQVNRKQRQEPIFAMLWRLTVQVIAVSAGALMLAFIFTGMNAYAIDVAIINTEMVASAEYIRDNIPENELMAIHDIGAVGYFAPRDMLDIAGLVTPEIIPIVADGDALWAYMEEHGAQYLMAFPDQIPNDDPDDPRLCRIFYTDSEITAQTKGEEGYSMAIYRLSYDATCEG